MAKSAIVSDGPLWGRRQPGGIADPEADEFQTDPCGVEGDRPDESRGRLAGFRRTLVGSKGVTLLNYRVNLIRFQTDPCGVEGWQSGDVGRCVHVFQTDPCGVEGVQPDRHRHRQRSFRRTLVGSKGTLCRMAGFRLGRFRRTLVGSKVAVIAVVLFGGMFQTDPCGVEGAQTPSARPP